MDEKRLHKKNRQISREETIEQDLSDFFRLFSEEKKKKKERFRSLIGEDGLNSFFEEISSIKVENKRKKEKDNKKLKAFENFIFSEPTDFENDEEILSGEINLTEEELIQPKEELLEKSLGLLAEPSDVKQQNDPLTPLDQKFATQEDLQKHYTLFLSRIQQQLSTLGGGGETNLAYMDMPLTYVTSSSYLIKHQDYYVGVNYAGAVTITLPTPRKNGKVYIVKDELGEASKGTNRYITILPSGSDLIDGRDRAILAFDYGSLTFVYRNGWRVV